MTIIKMLNDNINKMKRKKMLKSKRIKETKREGQPKGQNSEWTRFRRDFSEGTEKEGEERIARQHKLNEGEERKIL